MNEDTNYETIPETPLVTSEISVLEKLSSELSKPESENATIQNCRIGEMPMEAVDEALGDFVRDAFRVSKDDFDFNAQMQKHMMERILKNEYTPNQEIALYSNHNVNMNDKLAKLINPFSQISVAKTQADIAMRKEQERSVDGLSPTGGFIGSGDLRAVNATATKEVLQGLQALGNILKVIKDVDPDEANK